MELRNRISSKNNVLIYLISSMFVLLVLGYIDEGAYNFEWMKDAMNWLSFGLFVLANFLLQILFDKKILKNYTGKGKVLICAIGGVVIGPLILFVVAFLFASIIF